MAATGSPKTHRDEDGDRHPPRCFPRTAKKGGPRCGAAPAPFPQCGSQAETLDPDKPV